VLVNVVFNDEDKILILKKLYKLKGHKATELVNEFANKWTKSSITGC